jgi:hypothetical protein
MRQLKNCITKKETFYAECIFCGRIDQSDETMWHFLGQIERDGWKSDEDGAVCPQCEKARNKK